MANEKVPVEEEEFDKNTKENEDEESELEEITDTFYDDFTVPESANEMPTATLQANEPFQNFREERNLEEIGETAPRQESKQEEDRAVYNNTNYGISYERREEEQEEVEVTREAVRREPTNERRAINFNQWRDRMVDSPKERGMQEDYETIKLRREESDEKLPFQKKYKARG